MAVADRVAVLRLGRNNGVFDVARRQHARTSSPRSPAPRTTPSRGAPRVAPGGAGHATTGQEAVRPHRGAAPIARRPARTSGCVAAQRPQRRARRRSRAGCAAATSASLPVVVGLVVIWAVLPDPQPASSCPARNLVNLTLQCAAVGIDRARHRAACCCVGEIDLSVGSVSGLAAAVAGGACSSATDWPLWLAVLAAVVLPAPSIGWLYAPVVQPVRRAELRHHAGRAARLPRPAALRARHRGLDQPAVRLRRWSNSPSCRSCPPWLSYALVVLAAGRPVSPAGCCTPGSAARAGLSATPTCDARAAQRGAAGRARRSRSGTSTRTRGVRLDVRAVPRRSSLVMHYLLSAHQVGPVGLRGRRQRRGGPPGRHQRQGRLHLGVRALLHASRRSAASSPRPGSRRPTRAAAAATPTSTPSRRRSSAARACSAGAARRSRRCSASSSSSRSPAA